MFPWQRHAHRPPLLAWMLLTTRGKKYKPFKPEKTQEQSGTKAQHAFSAQQKAEAKRATRNRRRETSRWLNSYVRGSSEVFVAAAPEKKNHSSRRRRRQSAAEIDVEHVDVDRALWEFMFNYQQSLEGVRKSERAWRRFERFKAQQAASCKGDTDWAARESRSRAQGKQSGGGDSARRSRSGSFRSGAGGGFGGSGFGSFGFASFADLDEEEFSFSFSSSQDRGGWTWAEFDVGDLRGERTYAHFDMGGSGRRGGSQQRRGASGDGNSDESWDGRNRSRARDGGSGGRSRAKSEGGGSSCPVASSLRVLGLEADGPLTGDLLRAAWKTKALENHPDRHPDPAKPAAEARFRQAHEAYVLLQSRLT